MRVRHEGTDMPASTRLPQTLVTFLTDSDRLNAIVDFITTATSNRIRYVDHLHTSPMFLHLYNKNFLE